MPIYENKPSFCYIGSKRIVHKKVFEEVCYFLEDLMFQKIFFLLLESHYFVCHSLMSRHPLYFIQSTNKKFSAIFTLKNYRYTL